jgi:hypothetical protein
MPEKLRMIMLTVPVSKCNRKLAMAHLTFMHRMAADQTRGGSATCNRPDGAFDLRLPHPLRSYGGQVADRKIEMRPILGSNCVPGKWGEFQPSLQDS